jgi:hypothetical protein
MLRQRFDTIEIVDLRGDSRGARPAGIETDENVFAIQAGVCILTAVAAVEHRESGAEARVRYADVWRHGAFTARDKRNLLETVRAGRSDLAFVDIGRSDLEDFLPRAFEGLDWPGLPEVFIYRSSGVQTKRDEFVYGFSAAMLLDRWRSLASLPPIEAEELFHPTRARTIATALATPLAAQEIELSSYRPLDRRYLIRATRVIDRRRPNLQLAWGSSNRAIYALPAGTGAGPAVWLHSLLPDYHSFRGSYGGYAFPLWDRRHGEDAHNLNPGLLEGLAGAYGRPVTAEDAFDAITALLSATSYTRRFAWDLEETFAHIPFPADVNIFLEAVRIGAEIRTLETFAREPVAAFHSARLAGHATGVTLAVPQIGRAFQADGRGGGTVPLQEDQSLRLVNLPERVWQFAVSDYRVLPRWLAARTGEALNAAFQRAILDVAWRIEELLHWFDAADHVLVASILASLSRLDLRLVVPGTAQAHEVEEELDDPRDSTG